ncbi:hypothetical protein C5613_30690 [Rhodococcus opacus]|uniref:Uncharacterized protein n=1 Tax=Rhodococcus opacus TaxID=37919 RepID=A0A2S8IXA7_RHOOP|nr:hypothetical protein C5613_30690 [Rhodococcus opacus]
MVSPILRPYPRPPHRRDRHAATRAFSREATKGLTRAFWMSQREPLRWTAIRAYIGSCGSRE